jgi:hypothetical protein
MAKAQTVKVPPSFTKAVRFIQDKGFPYIKVELEAGLRRSGSTSPCVECSARGWTRCVECNAKGWIRKSQQPNSSGITHEVVECTPCNGGGSLECPRCAGRGYVGASWDDNECKRYILNHVEPATRKAIVYSRFYRDGSVDSEYTFTIATSEAHRVIEIMRAFAELGQVVGNGLSVSNAGLHIAALPDGKYPCKPGMLDQRLMRNFRNEVAKLLPALYFLGTHTNKTRGLGYRRPYVSAIEKYSAIYTHGDTAIEYRLFDPCFDKLEAFYDKIEIVAATLKYYSDTKVKASYERFNMSDIGALARIYGSLDNYDALLKTVKEVKPDKSFTSLKAERKFTISKGQIRKAIEAEYAGWKRDTERNYQRNLQDFTKRIEGRIKAAKKSYKALLKDSTGRWPWSLQRAIEMGGYKPEALASNNKALTKFVTENSQIFGFRATPPEKPKMLSLTEFSRQQESRGYTLTSSQPLDEENEYEDDEY